MTMGDKIDQLCEESEQRGIEIGEKRGEQRGIEIGEQRGIEIGEQRGIEIGKQKMLNMIKEAAKRAGVSEEIEKLLKVGKIYLFTLEINLYRNVLQAKVINVLPVDEKDSDIFRRPCRAGSNNRM